MTHNEMIAVIAAHRDGKAIEAKRNDWEPCDSFEWTPVYDACFAFNRFTYRIKPSPPKPREWWIVEVRKGAISQGFIDKSHAADAVKTLNLCAKSDKYASLIHVIEVLPSSGEEKQ